MSGPLGRVLDVVVVGGGIIGLATGLALLDRRPGLRMAVLEKEPRLASHQSGRNSGVLHSGIYYRPGSLKGRLCVEGAEQMLAFCRRRGIPHSRTGKVLLAVEDGEIPMLEALLERGRQSGVPGLSWLSSEELSEIEPHARGIAAVHVPTAGVVDYRAAALAMASEIDGRGGFLHTKAPVRSIRPVGDALDVETGSGVFRTRMLVNCAGLYADRVARLAGTEPPLLIVPFRGEYHRIRRPGLVRSLIYPVPDPQLPFLGVHLTRRVDGMVEAGPNAVLALAREGYRRRDMAPVDLLAMGGYAGFWRLARKHWRAGLAEIARSLSRRAFLRAARRLVPELRLEDLEAGGTGVRAQAVAPDGDLIDDFVVIEGEGSVHVLNAPSPGATSSLAIGRHLAVIVELRLEGTNGCSRH